VKSRFFKSQFFKSQIPNPKKIPMEKIPNPKGTRHFAGAAVAAGTSVSAAATVVGKPTCNLMGYKSAGTAGAGALCLLEFRNLRFFWDLGFWDLGF
jgi:hypothetical protein